jgi:hypothetical protein
MMVFSADDPAELEKVGLFGKGLPKEESRFRDAGKIGDVEAASWVLPRLGRERYNAWEEGFLSLLPQPFLASRQLLSVNIVFVQDESLKFLVISPPSDSGCNKHPAALGSFCS